MRKKYKDLFTNYLLDRLNEPKVRKKYGLSIGLIEKMGPDYLDLYLDYRKKYGKNFQAKPSKNEEGFEFIIKDYGLIFNFNFYEKPGIFPLINNVLRGKAKIDPEIFWIYHRNLLRKKRFVSKN